jgi:predicted dehydrogenase
MADICLSSISAAGRPRWRICGTKGAILDDGTVEKGCKVMLYRDGQVIEQRMLWEPGAAELYYVNIADHLLAGDELMVKPEQARRVIGVIQCAEQSSQAGQAVEIPGE